MDNEEKEIVLDYTKKKNDKEITKSNLLCVANGIVGNIIYQSIFAFLFSLIVSVIVSVNNPNMMNEDLLVLYNETWSKYPFDSIIYLLGGVTTLLVFIYLVKWDKFKSIFKNIMDSKIIKYGFLTALCIMGFSLIYNNLIINIFNLSSSGNANQEDVVNMIQGNYVLGFISVAIMAPIVEELTFRYFLFGEAKKKNRVLAYVLSAGVFMVMHSLSSFTAAEGSMQAFLEELLYLPAYLFAGLAFCYVYEKTDNLNICIFAHMINNFISFLAVVSLL